MGKEEDTDRLEQMERPVDCFVSNPASNVKSKDSSSSKCNGVTSGGGITPNKPTKLKNLIDDKMFVDVLHKKCIEDVTCTSERCMGSQYAHMTKRAPGEPRPKQELIVHAKDLIDQYYQSIKQLNTAAHLKRMEEVMSSIESTGSYDLTLDELTFGAKTGWRNAPRCIGRIHWSKLQVFDARHVTTPREMFDAICKHMKYGTNDGRVRSSITVFRGRTDGKRDFRVWNTHAIQYAGYRQPDGTVIGDPVNCEFTEVCINLGWKPKGGMFDILPLVISAESDDPELFEVPPELILEIHLQHPKYPWFAQLGYKWAAIPFLTSFLLDCGGIEFTACPFNGWFMGSEIARDLCDPNRYNITEKIALMMGIDTQNNSSLWKDQAFLEVNIAILYSYQLHGIAITDHHSVSDSFIKHLENEQRLRGGCPADWVWIVPPIGGSLTKVFHQEMVRYNMKPSYEYQIGPWKMQNRAKSADQSKRRLKFRNVASAVLFSTRLMRTVLSKRVSCLVLYATETGTSERFARTTCDVFMHAFDAKVMCMNEYDVTQLNKESLVLVVCSTFGSGDAPEQGESFSKELTRLRTEYENNATATSSLGPVGNVRYSVFALGSRAYSRCNFCAFGRYLDNVFNDLGAKRIVTLGEGDQLYAQEESFRNWAKEVFQTACDTFGMTDVTDITEAIGSLTIANIKWSQSGFRMMPTDEKEVDICEGLSKLHSKSVVPCKLLERTQLQNAKSPRQTILAKLDNVGAVELLYHPGDHVGIYPPNPPQLVDAILARLHNAPPPDQVIQVEFLEEIETPSGMIETWKQLDRIPRCSLRTALTRYLDITTPPGQSFLKLLAAQASRDDDRAALESLATVSQQYEEWKYDKTPNLLEVLDEFPSLKVPPSLIVTQLPLLQQRFYSISSSPLATPDQIHATVTVVRYRTQGGSGPVREGLCSGWLNRCQIGEMVPCILRTEPGFRMPDDKTLPMFAVSAGAGIAPFRSFWQHRKINKDMLLSECGNGQNCGEIHLFFGCRNPSEDFIYETELRQMKSQGVLTGGYIAFSRQPGKPKVYVQEILRQMSAVVFDGIVNRGGHLYVCGGSEMASDVIATLEQILQKEGGMTPDGAQKYLHDLQYDNRFHKDIFGANIQRCYPNVQSAEHLNGAVKEANTDSLEHTTTTYAKPPEAVPAKYADTYPVKRTMAKRMQNGHNFFSNSDVSTRKNKKVSSGACTIS